jgi:hypothetical protein
VGTFNFSAKYLSKKDSSTMLPELTEFVPATIMGIVNFDAITNNYEVIYVIKTVMKVSFKKNRYEFSSASSKYGSTTFNFSAKYLSKKDSSTMLPELTEFVPATIMGIVRKVL